MSQLFKCNFTSTIIKELDEIKQLIQKERSECQKKLEELYSSLCEKIDQLMDYIISDCSPPEEEEITLCNITSSDWRRVAYINMTDPEAECPSGLKEVSNSTTGQRACGRNVNVGCSSVNTTYSHVCGYARGYQYYNAVDALMVSPSLKVTQGNIFGHLQLVILNLQAIILLSVQEMLIHFTSQEYQHLLIMIFIVLTNRDLFTSEFRA